MYIYIYMCIYIYIYTPTASGAQIFAQPGDYIFFLLCQILARRAPLSNICNICVYIYIYVYMYTPYIMFCIYWILYLCIIYIYIYIYIYTPSRPCPSPALCSFSQSRTVESLLNVCLLTTVWSAKQSLVPSFGLLKHLSACLCLVLPYCDASPVRESHSTGLSAEPQHRDVISILLDAHVRASCSASQRPVTNMNRVV